MGKRSVAETRKPPARATLAVLAAVALGGLTISSRIDAADHTDSPLVAADQAADIADVYSFRSGDDLVLAMTISNVQAAPEIELGRSIFDPSVLYQLNIDTNGDAVEDLVVQSVFVGDPRDQVMQVRGPAAPTELSPRHRLLDLDPMTVSVSTGTQAVTEERDGIRIFAGVRDDPFFFDLSQFLAILGGSAGGFDDPGVDAFADLNAYAIVVQIPLEMLGDPATLAIWGTTARP